MILRNREHSTSAKPADVWTSSMAALLNRSDLTPSHAESLAYGIMRAKYSDAQIAAALIALRCKGETAAEIAGFAKALRKFAVPFSDDMESAIDTCGTGGDCLGTFNVSTASAIVAAATGCPVAKHGNRSISSQCGSTDVLKALGISPDETSASAIEAVRETRITFLHAPSFHPALRQHASLRQALGFKTIFNIVGPLCNPAGVRRQLIGVFSESLQHEVAHAAHELGLEHVLVVHGRDGADEITLTDRTKVVELQNGSIQEYDIAPEQFGLDRCSPEDVRGGHAAQNAQIIVSAFSDTNDPARDFVALNAGAALYVSGRADSMNAGVRLAIDTIRSGAALRLLNQLRDRAKHRDSFRTGVSS